MGWAADAATNPDVAHLKETGCEFICRYVGTRYQAYGVTRDYIDRCVHNGVGVGLIFEEWANQFKTGFDGAVQSCHRMMEGWERLGAPKDGSVIPMVVLVDPAPSAVVGAEDALQAYARGWDYILSEYGFAEWTGYGSKYGLDLAARATSRMTRKWGVGTWGYGERPNGSLPDHVDADMIQHANKHAPVPRTDYNTVFRPDMGQWGGPVVQRKQERIYDMYIGWGQTVYGVPLAFLVSGGRVLKTFDGPSGYLGITQSALDWKAGAGREAVPYVLLDPETIGALAYPWPPVGVRG